MRISAQWQEVLINDMRVSKMYMRLILHTIYISLTSIPNISSTYTQCTLTRNLTINLIHSKSIIHSTLIWNHNFSQNSVIRSLEVVVTIFSNQNHSKCEWNPHFGWFWLLKIVSTIRIRVQKRQKNVKIESPNLFE